MSRMPKERIAYSAIVDRPPLILPDSARMVVWPIVNIEYWDIRRPMPRAVLPPPMGQPLNPDHANWAWHEYGMRVGFWRLFECMRLFNITPTLALNGAVCGEYPRVAQAAAEAGWEFMGHGFVQIPMHMEDQRAAIRQTIEEIRAFTGKPPRGWESPGLTETFDTIDLLAEEGIEYVADWVIDDQPCEIATAKGSVVAMPYTVEINDVPMMAVSRHASDEWLKRGMRQFDRLYQESAALPGTSLADGARAGAGARVMAISVHPFLSGVPHRIGYVEELFDYVLSKPGVVCWTGDRILDWYLQARPSGR